MDHASTEFEIFSDCSSNGIVQMTVNLLDSPPRHKGIEYEGLIMAYTFHFGFPPISIGLPWESDVM